MPTVYLGNVTPVGFEGESHQVTVVHANEPNRLMNLNTIKSLWPYHSDNPPAWVESEDSRLAEDIADTFTDGVNICSIGKPEDWDETPVPVIEQPEETIEDPVEEESEPVEEEVDNG